MIVSCVWVVGMGGVFVLIGFLMTSLGWWGVGADVLLCWGVVLVVWCRWVGIVDLDVYSFVNFFGKNVWRDIG